MGRVRTAVLPVAGLGTRFLPVTKAVPKEMLPLVDRPCIEYIVAEAVRAGIERIVMVSSRGKDALVDYFDSAPTLERHLADTGRLDLLDDLLALRRSAEFVFIRQAETLGLGHAVLTARPAVTDEPFAVLLGDDVIDSVAPAIGQLVAARRRPDEAVVALMRVPRQDVRSYGVCAGDMLDATRMAVHAMVEKPDPADAPSDCAIVGRYVLPPDIFDVLARTPRGKGGEIQLTDAIAELAGQGRVTGLLFEGRRFDTGNVMGLLRATLHFTRKRPELRAALDQVLAELADS